MNKDNKRSIDIKIFSFGFKYGILNNANYIFDVRFLPNPYYIPELKEHNGTESVISEYVMNFSQSNEFLKKLCDLFITIIPFYIENDKTEIVIGIGCTGGKHRSVTIAEALYAELKKSGIDALVIHRDIDKE